MTNGRPPHFGPWTRAINSAGEGNYLPMLVQGLELAGQGGYLYLVDDVIFDKLIDSNPEWRERFTWLKLTPQYLIFAEKPKLQRILFLLAKFQGNVALLTQKVRELAEQA